MKSFTVIVRTNRYGYVEEVDVNVPNAITKGEAFRRVANALAVGNEAVAVKEAN